MDTQGRRPCEIGGRDWSDGGTSQGPPGVVTNHQKLQEAKRTQYIESQREHRNADLDFRLLTPVTVRKICFCYFKPPSVW